ncbi:hypothetical protein NLC29_03165 [Candidatus Aminicenantes bacterium AH-873-B07]|jgi:Tfp pilus assembly protein FimT|nr:hypothetical protein [Candidatus Aminicenantes bacterium AH-873-B07]
MREKGFSLLDLITTLSILSILLSISLPAFRKMSSNYQLQSATREICARLNYARYKSIFQKTKFKVKFLKRGYTVEKYNSAKKKWEKEKDTFFKNVIINANNSPIFHPNGTVSNLASIYISNSVGKYKITIAISGRIKTIKIK